MSETVGQERIGKTHTAAMCEGPAVEPKHTPEPWRMTEAGYIGIRCDERDKGLHWGFLPLLSPFSVNPDPRESTANARRIVACVNACEGISTAALEGGLIARLIDTLATSPVVCAGLVQAMEAAKLAEEHGGDDERDQT